MQNYDLPTREECFEILKEYHVPSHILRHSLAVCRLAVFLTKKLRAKGLAVDVNLVDRACLLHDMARVCDFDTMDYSKFEQTITQEDKTKWEQIKARHNETCHEDAAYDILKEQYPELALTIKKHRYMAMLDEKARPDTWEEKLLYYADMRVMNNRIVPLETRLKDAHKRNLRLHGSITESRINTAKVDPLIYKLEQEIFEKIALSPSVITDDFIDSYF
jgi:uncharacterized protein